MEARIAGGAGSIGSTVILDDVTTGRREFCEK